MPVAALLGSYQRPVLNQDPTVAAIPPGATATLISQSAPSGGAVVAVGSADVTVVWTLTAGSNSATSTGTAPDLQVLCHAGDLVTLTAQATGAPAFKVSASAVLLYPQLSLSAADLSQLTTLLSGTYVTNALTDLETRFTAANQVVLGTGNGTGALTDIATAMAGAGAAWTTYTPTVGGTGWAVGNGTVTGRYRLIDAKTLALEIVFTLGTTTTVGTGTLTLTLPASHTAASATYLFGIFVHSGVGTYPANLAVTAGAASGSVNTLTVAASPPSYEPSTSTAGKVPANTDAFNFAGLLEIQ